MENYPIFSDFILNILDWRSPVHLPGAHTIDLSSEGFITFNLIIWLSVVGVGGWEDREARIAEMSEGDTLGITEAEEWEMDEDVGNGDGIGVVSAGTISFSFDFSCSWNSSNSFLETIR